MDEIDLNWVSKIHMCGHQSQQNTIKYSMVLIQKTALIRLEIIILLLISNCSAACTHTAIPVVALQEINFDGSTSTITIGDFVDNLDCVSPQIEVETMPNLPLDGVTINSVIGSNDLEITVDSPDRDPFSVMVALTDQGQYYAYVVFQVRPLTFTTDPIFCTTYTSCMCDINPCQADANILWEQPFCYALTLLPAVQPDFIYPIKDNGSSVPQTYSMLPFTFQTPQENYGCGNYGYQLERKADGELASSYAEICSSDSYGAMTCDLNSFQFTMDTASDQMELDGGIFNYRLTQNLNTDYAQEFTGYFCYWPSFPPSIWADPTQSLTIIIPCASPTIVFQTSEYSVSGPTECSILTYTLDGTESWLTFDDLPVGHNGAELTVDTSSFFLADASFTFKVFGGAETVVEETFTIVFIDCSIAGDFGTLPDAYHGSGSILGQASTYMELGTYIWLKNNGQISIPLPQLNQANQAHCGTYSYEMSHSYTADPSLITLDFVDPTYYLVIDSDLGTSASILNTDVQFSVKNDIESEDLNDVVTISLQDCTGINSAQPGPLFEKSVGQNDAGPIQWNAFTNAGEACITDYTVTCSGPFMSAETTEPAPSYGSSGPVSSNICNDAFVITNTEFLKEIEETFYLNYFTSAYQGEYLVTITGTNPGLPTLSIVEKLVWRLSGSCNIQQSITGPTTLYTNPQISVFDGAGNEQTINYSRSNSDVFYAVGTNASYSITNNGSSPFGVSDPVSCVLKFTMFVWDPNWNNGEGKWQSDLANRGIDFISVENTSPTDVNLVFSHDVLLQGSGNQYYVNQNGNQYKIVASFEDDNQNNSKWEMEFTNYIFPSCRFGGDITAPVSNYNQDLATIESWMPFLSTQNLNQQIGAVNMPAQNDRDVCGNAADLVYSLEQINFPGGGYNTDYFEFDAAQRRVKVIVDDHTKVLQWDSSGNQICDLSVLQTEECTFQYEVYLTNTAMNGTLALMGNGEVIIKSECMRLENLYNANKQTWWQWNDDVNFLAGFQVRDPQVTLTMPQLFPVLDSVNDAYPLCGDLKYELLSPDESADTTILPSDQYGSNTGFYLPDTVENLIQMVYEVGLDNTEVIQVDVQSDDYWKAVPHTLPYAHQHQLGLQATFLHFYSPDMNYWHKTGGQDAMKFVVRDYCLGPTWSPAQLNILKWQELKNQNDANFNADATNGAQLYINKHVKSPSTIFYLHYQNYTKYDDLATPYVPSQNADCGYPVYRSPELASNVPILDIGVAIIPPLNETFFQFEPFNGLRFNVHGNFNTLSMQNFDLNTQITLSIYESDPSEYTPLEIINVKIRILPCLVNSFFGRSPNTMKDFNLYPGTSYMIEWVNFTQSPQCNYTIDYTLTVAKLDLNYINVPEFADLIENSRVDPPIAHFNQTNNTMIFSTDNPAYMDDEFVCYLNAHLDIAEDYQTPKIWRLPAWKVLVTAYVFIPPNSAPYLDGILLENKVEADKYTLLNLGQPTDTEMEGVYIKSIKMMPSVSWMKLRQSIDDASINSVDLEINPPQDAIGDYYNINLIIADLNVESPRTKEYAIVIEIVEIENKFIGVTLEEEPNVDTIQEAHLSEPSMYGEVTLVFDYEMGLPDGIEEWTSENEGADYFVFMYVPSTDSEIFFEEAEIEEHMSWSIESADSHEIVLKLNFTNPLAVSTSSRDSIEFNIKRPQDFLVQTEDGNRPMQWKQEDAQVVLVSQLGDAVSKELLESLNTAIEGTLGVFISSNFALTIFISGALQFLWGMVNALQMIVLSVLFSVMRPPHVEMVLTTIMEYVNFDFIDTAEMLEDVFGISKETTPFNEIFEKAHFESTSFIREIGCIIFFVLGFFGFVIIRQILSYVFKKYPASGRIAEIIEKKVKKVRYKVMIVRFLLEGCVELGICALICVLRINYNEPAQPQTQDGTIEIDASGRRLSETNGFNPGDWASNVFAIITLLGMFIAPFYLFHIAKVYHKDPTDPMIRQSYGKLFKEFSTDSFPQLNYSLIFILRRYTMVLVLTMLPSQRNIQINFQLTSTLFVMSYTTYVLPFQNMLMNYQETINEIWVLIASYHLFCFTEWVYDLETRFVVGWSLLVVIILNVATNMAIMGYVVISDSYKSTKKTYFTHQKKQILSENQRIREIRLHSSFQYKTDSKTRNFLRKSIMVTQQPPFNQLQSDKNEPNSTFELPPSDDKYAYEESVSGSSIDSQQIQEQSLGKIELGDRIQSNIQDDNKGKSGLNLTIGRTFMDENIDKPLRQIKKEKTFCLELNIKQREKEEQQRVLGNGTIIESFNDIDYPVKTPILPNLYQSIFKEERQSSVSRNAPVSSHATAPISQYKTINQPKITKVDYAAEAEKFSLSNYEPAKVDSKELTAFLNLQPEKRDGFFLSQNSRNNSINNSTSTYNNMIEEQKINHKFAPMPASNAISLFQDYRLEPDKNPLYSLTPLSAPQPEPLSDNFKKLESLMILSSTPQMPQTNPVPSSHPDSKLHAELNDIVKDAFKGYFPQQF